jgi:hypothetical protein
MDIDEILAKYELFFKAFGLDNLLYCTKISVALYFEGYKEYIVPRRKY